MNRPPKDILFGDNARKHMLKGIKLLTDAVQATLGPKGRNVIIRNKHQELRITKDGVSVAKEIVLKDEYENLGAELIKEAAIRTCAAVGDGTTTATVLAHAMIERGMKALEAGMNPVNLKKGIDIAVENLVAVLDKMAIPINTTEEVCNVATIAVNNDRLLGEIVTEAFEKVTKSGAITIEQARVSQTTLEIVKGLHFDSGYITDVFVTDEAKKICEYRECLIFLFDERVSAFAQVESFFTYAFKAQKPLLIICDDMNYDALQTLAMNIKYRGALFCAVRCPGVDEERQNLWKDLSLMTGAYLFNNKENGISPPKIPLSDITDYLGYANNVIVKANSTTLIGVNQEPKHFKKFNAHLDFLRAEIAKEDDEGRKEALQTRISKLLSGVAIIRVGGQNQYDISEKKDRVEDAVHATRAALEEGILPGGGLALYNAFFGMLNEYSEDKEINTGISIVLESLKRPIEQIAINAGCYDKLQKGLMSQKVLAKGFDARKEEFVDMFEAGIIDPAKVVKTALKDAASVAGLFLTTEVAMLEEREIRVGGIGDQSYRIKTD